MSQTLTLLHRTQVYCVSMAGRPCTIKIRSRVKLPRCVPMFLTVARPHDRQLRKLLFSVESAAPWLA